MTRRAIFTRNDVSWTSVRGWRRATRDTEIIALEAAKLILDPNVLAVAADEVAEHLRSMNGYLGGWMISTVAVGHSQRPDSFAVHLAQGVADRLKLPFAKLFADRFTSGARHPRQSPKLPALEKIAIPTRPLIIVDDVATSGWHLEEALTSLRADNVTVKAVTWISGTVR